VIRLLSKFLGSRLDRGKGNGRKEKERRWDERRREERDIK